MLLPIWIKARRWQRGSSYRKQILDNYSYYSKIYSDQNNFKKASEFKDSYIKLYKEIFNADLVKNISRIQTDYQEQENLKTILLNNEVIYQSRMLNWLLITVIISTGALGYVIYRNYRKIKAVNQAFGVCKTHYRGAEPPP